MNKRKYYIYIAAAVVWMAVIFVNSAFDGGESSGLSEMLIGWLVRATGVLGDGPGIILFRDFLNGDLFHVLLRKAAHFVEFGILGLLVYLSCGVIDRIRNRIYMRGLASALFSLLYAVSDEVHQLFVPGRVGAVTDVLIDFCGAMLFIGIIVLVSRGKDDRETDGTS